MQGDRDHCVNLRCVNNRVAKLEELLSPEDNFIFPDIANEALLDK